MFRDSAGCRIVGTDYTSAHHRFSLALQPQDGQPEFNVAFTNVAAYRFDRSHFGIINAVTVESLADIIANDWSQLLIADQSGLWPGRLPAGPTETAAVASHLGLQGFKISIQLGACAWAISSDFILLGRRQRA